MAKKNQNFIARLRQSDESTKKRWLVIFSAGAIILIIGVWAAYLNLTVASVSVPAGLAVSSNQSFLKIFATGFAIIRDQATRGLANSYVYFNSKVREQNKFTVDRDRQNFILDDLEAAPLRPLP